MKTTIPEGSPYIVIGSGNNLDWIVFAKSTEDARDFALDDYSRSQIFDVRLATVGDVHAVLDEGKPWNSAELKAWLKQRQAAK